MSDDEPRGLGVVNCNGMHVAADREMDLQQFKVMAFDISTAEWAVALEFDPGIAEISVYLTPRQTEQLIELLRDVVEWGRRGQS